jgi:hypothetical protein
MAVTSPNKCTSSADPLAASHDDEIVGRRQSARPFGAKVRLRRVPVVADAAAKVSSLNLERPLSLGAANWPSCPLRELRGAIMERHGRVEAV